MPPHCDTLDGPVVTAAREAIETGDVNAVLPWVHATGEDAVRELFIEATEARSAGGEAARVADRWFFENVVRIHREGEGAPYTGLKPAGLDVGPVLPRAEAAIEKGDDRDLVRFLAETVEQEVHRRLDQVKATSRYDRADVPAARRHVDAMLDLELYSHHVYEFIRSAAGHSKEEPSGEVRTAAHAHVHA